MKQTHKVKIHYGMSILNQRMHGVLKQGPKPKWYWAVYAAAYTIWLYAMTIFCFWVSIMSFTYLLSGVMQ